MHRDSVAFSHHQGSGLGYLDLLVADAQLIHPAQLNLLLLVGKAFGAVWSAKEVWHPLVLGKHRGVLHPGVARLVPAKLWMVLVAVDKLAPVLGVLRLRHFRVAGRQALFALGENPAAAALVPMQQLLVLVARPQIPGSFAAPNMAAVVLPPLRLLIRLPRLAVGRGPLEPLLWLRHDR